MLIKEFGKRDNPIICLLHGGGLSWWSYQPIIDLLISDYHVICPIIEGHGEAGKEEFTTIEDSANHLIKILDDRYNGHVHLLAGLSIGAQIVVEVLSSRPNIADKAIIESALVYPIPGTKLLVGPSFKLFYGLIKHRWFSKLQAKTLFVSDELFETYYQDSLLMSRNSLVNMSISNGTYQLKDTLTQVSIPTLLLVGQKEIGLMKKSAELLHTKLSNSKLVVLPNMGHGELSLVQPKHYVKMLFDFINN
jgi:pimeloyl-ACP methyl ester carboxylesterase